MKIRLANRKTYKIFTCDCIFFKKNLNNKNKRLMMTTLKNWTKLIIMKIMMMIWKYKKKIFLENFMTLKPIELLNKWEFKDVLKENQEW